MHFDMENGLAGALREFQSALTPTSAKLVDLSQVPSYDWMRHVSVRNSSFVERQASMNKQHSRKVSLVFSHLEPIQLAEHITYLEHKVIRRITVSFLANILSVFWYFVDRASQYNLFFFISNLIHCFSLYHMAALHLYNFVLMFLYRYRCFACSALQILIFCWPCISV